MKCIINEKEIFELTPVQKNLLAHLVPAHQIEDHVAGLIHYIIGTKLRECAQKLFDEWRPKLLKEGVESIPLSDLKFAELIFSHKDYVSRAVDNGNNDTAAESTLPQQ